MSKILFHNAEYLSFLGDLKKKITAARTNTVRAINRDLLRLYWEIGKGIVEKQKEHNWGESVIENLAVDLQTAFFNTHGFSARNLWNMKQFYEAYPDQEIWQQAVAKLKSKKGMKPNGPFLQQLVAEIPWGQHILILNKIAAPIERLYYVNATAKFGWTRNVLLNQIKADAYAHTLKQEKNHNFGLALPKHYADQADEVLKSSYNLEFLGIGKLSRERTLETKLIDKLRNFILELGYGFCFVGSQYKVSLGEKDYFIDLLFYHRFLKSLVAIELKVGAFKPEYAGKMDFYLNVLNEKEKATDDRASIGIILCAEKNSLEVEFSLKTKKNPIGVAQYQMVTKLPKELEGKLPTERQLQSVFRERP